MLIVNYKHIPFWKEKFLRDNEGKTVEDPWVFGVGILSMHTGINEITRDNADEFYARCKIVEACTGNLMVSPDGPVFIDPATVERFIGVTTNASPYTTAAFYRHVRDDLMKSPREEYTKAIAALEAERKEAVLATVEGSDKAAAED